MRVPQNFATGRPVGQTLDALAQLVGPSEGPPKRRPRQIPRDKGVAFTPRKIPRGNAYGYHRKRQTPRADLGPLAGKQMPRGLTDPSDATRSIGPSHPSDASRRANFARVPARKPIPRGPVRSVPRGY